MKNIIIYISFLITSITFAFDYQVIIDGNDYVCYNNLLVEVKRDTDPNVTISYALDNGYDIKINTGNYIFTSNFNGFDLKAQQRVTCSPKARFEIPLTYTGYFMKLDHSCLWDGGDIGQHGSGTAEWVFCRNPDSGLTGAKVTNVIVTYAKVVINLDGTNHSHYSIGNKFEHIYAKFFKRGIDLKGATHQNMFNDLLMQPSSWRTEHGASIDGQYNLFIGVHFTDWHTITISPRMTHIVSAAIGTTILGGYMTRDYAGVGKFLDEGSRTKYIDQAHNNIHSPW